MPATTRTTRRPASVSPIDRRFAVEIEPATMYRKAAVAAHVRRTDGPGEAFFLDVERYLIADGEQGNTCDLEIRCLQMDSKPTVESTDGGVHILLPGIGLGALHALHAALGECLARVEQPV